MDNNTIIQKRSLEVIISALKVVNATSPEAIEMKKDLERVADAIQDKDKKAIIECNKSIVRSYPHILNVASSYGLVPMNDDELMVRSLGYQKKSLHQIAHYLIDILKTENINTKGSVLIEETFKNALGYLADKCFEEK